jgi:hypothetical protein
MAYFKPVTIVNKHGETNWKPLDLRRDPKRAEKWLRNLAMVWEKNVYEYTQGSTQTVNPKSAASRFGEDPASDIDYLKKLANELQNDVSIEDTLTAIAVQELEKKHARLWDTLYGLYPDLPEEFVGAAQKGWRIWRDRSTESKAEPTPEFIKYASYKAICFEKQIVRIEIPQTYEFLLEMLNDPIPEVSDYGALGLQSWRDPELHKQVRAAWNRSKA